MRRTLERIFLAGFICMFVFNPGCILEEKMVELVFTDEAFAAFDENQTSETFATPYDMNFGSELDDILLDNGISKEQIVHASLVSVSYGVTSFTQPNDWIITGMIKVERSGVAGSDTLMKYTSQSVEAALDKRIPVKLHREGVDIINEALVDYYDNGMYPELTFTVDNGSARDELGDPPSPSNPIVFKWNAWLVIQVVIVREFEVPDPF